MIQYIFNQLYKILVDLSADCQSSIDPQQVILEETKEESKYHFRVPNNSFRKQIIGWGNLRPSRSEKFGKNLSCAIVSIYAELLNEQDPEYIKKYNINANYGRLPGLVQFAVCQVGDNDYKLTLRAVIEAARNLVSGKRYKWQDNQIKATICCPKSTEDQERESINLSCEIKYQAVLLRDLLN